MRGTRFLSALAASLLAAGCVTGSDLPDIKPGERPPLHTDEAGLWMMMDKAEDQLKTSGRIVEDDALNRYLGEIVCRLAPDHCKDIRVYIVRTPNFNAAMSPNGSMHVWTGMLLRAQNEAQLAYVMGHEVAHYLRRHSLQRWQALRNTTDFLAFFQVAMAIAGVPVAGEAAQLIALGGLSGYSRDQEREADDYGLRLMANAGYDPDEAAKVWVALKQEKDAEENEATSVFFASHPDSEERAETMAKAAAALKAKSHGLDAGSPRYAGAIDTFRDGWLRDEIRQKRFNSFRVLLEQQHRAIGDAPLLDFYRGEMHRLRAEEGDAEKALAAYERATRNPNAPPEAFRSLGLALWDRSDHAGARRAFEAYLVARPNAKDRRMIAAYIDKLEGKKP